MTDEIESKSQKKRMMTALQKLGEALVDLPSAQLARIPLEPNLLAEIRMAQSLKSHGAIRRQLQYIGKLMRDVDPEPIQIALEKTQLKSKQSKAHFHRAERWRDQLVAEGDATLEKLVAQFPKTDHQYLRQLVRKAQASAADDKKAAIEIFRYLHTLIN